MAIGPAPLMLPDLGSQTDFSDLLALAQTLSRQGKYFECIEQCQTILKTDPKNVDAHRELNNVLKNAKALREAGNSDEFIKICHAIIKAESNQGEAYFLLGRTYARQKDFSTAVSHYEQALKQNYYNFMTTCYIAEALRDDHKLNEALEQVNNALKLKDTPDRDYYCAIQVRASIFVRLGRYAESIEDLQNLLVHLTDTPYITKKNAFERRIKQLESFLATQPVDGRSVGTKSTRSETPFALTNTSNSKQQRLDTELLH